MESGLKCNYFSLLLQHVVVQIEESAIWRIVHFVDAFLSSFSMTPSGRRFIEKAQNFVSRVLIALASFVSVKFLQLHPISVDVSALVDSNSRKTSSLLFRPIVAFLSGLGAVLGSLESIPLRLRSFVIEQYRGPAGTLIHDLADHYTRQALRETYKVLGSLDILGDPLGFVGHVRQGVSDFMYEPSSAVVADPVKFGKQFAKGSTSLVSHTAQGVMYSLGKFTGTLGKGIALLSMDEKYVSKRVYETRKSRKKHGRKLREDLVSAGIHFGEEVISGVSGVVKNPLKGIRSRSAKAFVKGIGQGAIGLFVKPIAGALNFASRSLESAAGSLHDEEYGERLRPNRYLKRGEVVKPLDPLMTLGGWVLSLVDLTLKRPSYDEQILLVEELVSDGGFVVISDRRIAGFASSSGNIARKTFSVEFDEWVGIFPQEKHVVITQHSRSFLKTGHIGFKFHHLLYRKPERLCERIKSCVVSAIEKGSFRCVVSHNNWNSEQKLWMSILRSTPSLPHETRLDLLETALESPELILNLPKSNLMVIFSCFRVVAFSLDYSSYSEQNGLSVAGFASLRDRKIMVSQSLDDQVFVNDKLFLNLNDHEEVHLLVSKLKFFASKCVLKVKKAWVGFAEEWINIDSDIKKAFQNESLLSNPWNTLLTSRKHSSWVEANKDHVRMFIILKRGFTIVRRSIAYGEIIKL